MVGYPILNDENINTNDDMLSDRICKSASVLICDYGSVIFFTALLVTIFGVNPAFASDIPPAIAGNATKSKSFKAIVFLAALDAASCTKAGQCFTVLKKSVKESVITKAAKDPKIATAVVCTAAIFWCGRGVAGRAGRARRAPSARAVRRAAASRSGGGQPRAGADPRRIRRRLGHTCPVARGTSARGLLHLGRHRPARRRAAA